MAPISRRLVGRNAAAIATLGLALNPLHVFYSHFSRSYSLACLGGLLLVGLLRRVVDEPSASWRSYFGIAWIAALIPYVHPSALAVVVSVGLGAMALMLRRGRAGRPLLQLALSFVAAAVLCSLLYLPAWEPFWAFYSAMVGAVNPVAFGAIDVGRLMFGSTVAAWAALLSVPLASLWMLRSGSDSAWLLVPAALLPIVLLPVQSPIASDVGYAHDLLVSIPFVLMIVAWAIVAFASRVQRDPRASTRLAISLGSGIFVLAHVAGPLGLAHTDDGPFANGFIRQTAQPEYDTPSPGTPGFYARLAGEPGDVRIIEAPALVDLRALLYRNYYLQHGKDVLLGFFTQQVGVTGPYVALLDAQQIHASGADYLVYHRDIEREVREYWDTIDPVEREALAVGPSTGEQQRRLRAMLGEPFHESDDLLVWKLNAGEKRE